jgi:hypothetical protein
MRLPAAPLCRAPTFSCTWSPPFSCARSPAQARRSRTDVGRICYATTCGSVVPGSHLQLHLVPFQLCPVSAQARRSRTDVGRICYATTCGSVVPGSHLQLHLVPFQLCLVSAQAPGDQHLLCEFLEGVKPAAVRRFSWCGSCVSAGHLEREARLVRPPAP